MGWDITGIMEWSGKFLIYAGVSHNVDHFPYQVTNKIRKFFLDTNIYYLLNIEELPRTLNVSVLVIILAIK